MRIGLVSRELWPFGGAGIGVYAAAMARAWARAGHHVHLITAPYPDLPASGVLDSGVHVHVADPASAPPLPFHFLRHAWAAHARLRALHAAAPFDYIEFPDYGGEGCVALACRQAAGEYAPAVIGVRLHTPTVLCRSLNDEAWLSPDLAALEHAEAQVLAGADVLISPSHALLQWVRDHLPRTVVIPGEVVPYPFDFDASFPAGAVPAAPERAAAPTTADAGQACIVYAGRLERRKGVHVLVSAVCRLLDAGRDLRVRLIGGDTRTGPGASSCAAWLRRAIPSVWQDRFEFAGAQSRAETIAAMTRAHVCCFPSLWENFPNACLEAMAAGAAVVASDSGGLAEIIRHEESGLLFRSGQAADLSRALARVLDDAELCRRLRREAPRRVAELCDPPAIVARLEALIRQVQGPGGGVRPGNAAPSRDRAGRSGVGIVLATENAPAAAITRTLDSLAAQSVEPDDVLVICCEDGECPPPVSSACLLGRRWRMLPCRGWRLGEQWDAGVRAAQARWIVTLRAGVILEPRFLHSSLDALERAPGTRWLWPAWTRPGVGAPSAAPEPAASDCWPAFVPGPELPLDLLLAGVQEPPPAAIFERDLIAELEGWDSDAWPDEPLDLWCRIAARNLQGVVLTEVLVHDSGQRHRADPPLPPVAHSRARLIARHAPTLAHPDRLARLLLARHAPLPDVETIRRRIVSQNLRYRLADHINHVLKTLRLQRAVKGLVIWLTGWNQARRR